MKYVVWTWVPVCALLLLPLVGCSGSTNDGTGGDAGTGGTAGSGGTVGLGGTGGSEPVPPGLWTGTGQGGADGASTICFHVRADGNALVKPANASPECGVSSIDVNFPDCNGRFATTEEVPIVNGAFHLLNEQGGLAGYWDISGALDGDTASGEATVQAVGDTTCSGSWMATPSE